MEMISYTHSGNEGLVCFYETNEAVYVNTAHFNVIKFTYNTALAICCGTHSKMCVLCIEITTANFFKSEFPILLLAG